jgi:hypothetical protein
MFRSSHESNKINVQVYRKLAPKKINYWEKYNTLSFHLDLLLSLLRPSRSRSNERLLLSFIFSLELDRERFLLVGLASFSLFLGAGDLGIFIFKVRICKQKMYRRVMLRMIDI